jgi:hypothetical protein
MISRTVCLSRELTLNYFAQLDSISKTDSWRSSNNLMNSFCLSHRLFLSRSCLSVCKTGTAIAVAR